MGSHRHKFLESSGERRLLSLDVKKGRLYEFDEKVHRLSASLREGRESLERGVRNCGSIDPVGPLPRLLPSKTTRGTNTEPCLVIPLQTTTDSQWDKEWKNTLQRATHFYAHPPTLLPLSKSKLRQKDFETSELGDSWFENREPWEDADDEESDSSTWVGDPGGLEFSSSSTLAHGPFITPFHPKTQSMSNLSAQLTSHHNEDRARSMELLTDNLKHAHLRAPENLLMSGREPSAHELRVQMSLGKLEVPDWYRKYSGVVKPPNGSGKKDFGSGTGLAGGWAGLSASKTTSLTSLQSTGRYSAGSGRFNSGRLLSTGTGSVGGRCGDSLTSPNSTTCASPSPYYERSSFTYGMSYGLSRLGSGRMSCGASPASLSPSPSPVGGLGSATSTPTSSQPQPPKTSLLKKQPYLGWRSQERLAGKGLYRSPSERLAADLLKSACPKKISVVSGTESEKSSLGNLEISPKKETASDLSLNNSEESNSHKLNRVRSSIKEVSNAIVDYVNESRPLDEGMNGGASPRRGFVWLESSFVGTKPIDSPSTPDTPTLLLPRRLQEKTEPKTTPLSQPLFSRNEGMEERFSNSSSVSSPTLDDILDSLLALRRPKNLRSSATRGDKGHFPTQSTTERVTQAQMSLTTSPVTTMTVTTRTISSSARTIGKIESSFLTNPTAGITFRQTPSPVQPIRITPSLSPVSDWHLRMNQPIIDSVTNPEEFLFPSGPDDPFSLLTNEEDFLGIPSLGARAFNISPETNISHPETDEQADVFKSEGFGPKVPMIGSLVQDTSLPSSPGKHRRVSFDLDLEEKEERSSSRSRKDSDSLGQSVIHCRNSKCGKSGVGLEARREFKTCHNCNAYYCSRECRRSHWEKHKKVCMQSRVGALCKQIIAQIREDSEIVSHLSLMSRRGYLAKGRGCVKLFFSSPDRAERFLTGGFPDLPEPWYIAGGDILPEEMGGGVYSELSEQVQSYNSLNRFVLYVSLCVVNEVPTSGAVKWEREMIARSAKVRLLVSRPLEDETPHNQAAHLPPQEELRFPQETLVLRSVPMPSRQLNVEEERRMREVSFTNIQRQLSARGIELRTAYPEIYTRLCAYVERDEPFIPATIFPRNDITGEIFTCVIMPECSDSPPTPFGQSQDTTTIDISRSS